MWVRSCKLSKKNSQTFYVDLLHLGTNIKFWLYSANMIRPIENLQLPSSILSNAWLDFAYFTPTQPHSYLIAQYNQPEFWLLSRLNTVTRVFLIYQAVLARRRQKKKDPWKTCRDKHALTSTALLISLDHPKTDKTRKGNTRKITSQATSVDIIIYIWYWTAISYTFTTYIYTHYSALAFLLSPASTSLPALFDKLNLFFCVFLTLERIRM